MKRRILKFTGIGEVLTKEAQEKLDVFEDVTIFEDLTCDDGRTRAQYEALGMKMPQSLIKKEKEFDNGLDLEDEDYEVLEYQCRIYEEEIVGYVRSETKTMIFTKTGLTFTVKETVEEIDQQIESN